MKESPLPPEFIELSGKVHYVRERIRGKEWSSSCPQCGGQPHQNGELPDRFRMWTKAKIGKPFGWCRACSYKWTSEKDYKPDPARLEEWRLQRIEHETRIKEEAEQAIKNLTEVHKWEKYYSWLLSDKIASAYWTGAGIPDEFWWNEWKLGFDPAHSFWYDTGEGWKEHVTPTATIAARDITKRIINIKHRLLNPLPDGTKYRMEYKTGVEPLFISNLDLDKADYVIKCEGEKKAAVTFLTLDNPKIQVFGMPVSPSDDLLQLIKGKVIIDILDPNMKEWQEVRLQEAYKDIDYRVLRLPMKIDDMILRAGLDKSDMRSMLKQARRI
jgi:hypothetical protein